jgi:flagellar L-ring protein precursor FlgH
MNKFILLCISLFLLVNCNETASRLKRIGKAPALNNVDVPIFEEDEDEVSRRQQKLYEEHAHMRRTNSLWQPGSTQFFRDSRAWKIGDIIRVVVEIKDNASLNNSTEQNRSGRDSFGTPSLLGLESKLEQKTKINPRSWASVTSSRNHNGSGTISRKEDIKTEIAARVTKVLPNGNLMLQGSQQIRVNHELREITIAGIIRPKDISSDNSIKTNQIADARISYGGQGVVSDVQQPRIGSQVLDAIAPF